MSYRIRVAFYEEISDDMPTLVAAYDEYTADVWGGEPDFYREDLAKISGGTVREAWLTLDEDSVQALFAERTIPANVRVGVLGDGKQ